jgi:hypothetical protein
VWWTPRRTVLLEDAFPNSDCTESEGGIINKPRIGKNVEGSSRGLFHDTISILSRYSDGLRAGWPGFHSWQEQVIFSILHSVQSGT